MRFQIFCIAFRRQRFNSQLFDPAVWIGFTACNQPKASKTAGVGKTQVLDRCLAENKMGMLFFRHIRRGYQQAAGHSKVQDNMIAAFQPKQQKFTPAFHMVKGLFNYSAAKLVGGRMFNNLRLIDHYILNGKALHLWFQHSLDRFHFR